MLFSNIASPISVDSSSTFSFVQSSNPRVMLDSSLSLTPLSNTSGILARSIFGLSPELGHFLNIATARTLVQMAIST